MTKNGDQRQAVRRNLPGGEVDNGRGKARQTAGTERTGNHAAGVGRTARARLAVVLTARARAHAGAPVLTTAIALGLRHGDL